MTPKQKAFAEFYAQSGNGTDAAIKAGYSADTAKQMASENLTKPNVVEYLATLTKDATDNRIADAIEQQRFYTAVMRDTNEKTSERLKACETLGRMQGNFTDRVQHSGAVVQMPVTIEIVGV